MMDLLDKLSRDLTQGKAPPDGMPDLDRGRRASRKAGLLAAVQACDSAIMMLGGGLLLVGMLATLTGGMGVLAMWAGGALAASGLALAVAPQKFLDRILQREHCHMSAWHDVRFPEDAPVKLEALKALGREFNWEAHIDAGAPVKPMKPLKLSRRGKNTQVDP